MSAVITPRDSAFGAARTANAEAGIAGGNSSMTTITLRGRCVVPGRAEGEALVTKDRISGWGGIDSRTGTIVETRHELRGVSFAGKVLVFPGAKGSSGWSAAFHMARTMGSAPAALLFNEMSTKIALGAVVTRAPAMTDFDQDPLALIATGDWVIVDADQGIVEIRKPPTTGKTA
jgi:uncharacterized protein